MKRTDLLGFTVPLNEILNWGAKKENEYYKDVGGEKVLDTTKVASYLVRKWEVERSFADEFVRDNKTKPGVRDLPWDEEKLVNLYDENPKWDVENAVDAAFSVWPGPGSEVGGNPAWGKGFGDRNLPADVDKLTPGVTSTAWWHKKDQASSYIRDKLGKDSSDYWDKFKKGSLV